MSPPPPAAGLALALAAAGCTAAGAREALRAELAGVRAGLSLPAPSPFGRDEPGQVHVHTRLSHDSPGPLEEVLEGCRRTGATWVCLTDHTNPAAASGQPRGAVGGVLVVPGQEISAWGASVHGLGLEGTVAKTAWRPLSEYLSEVRARGGRAFYGHATHFDEPPEDAPDGVCAYDLSDDFRAMSAWDAPAVLHALASADPDVAAEAFLLFVQTPQRDHLALWDGWLARGPCAGVAESDAHGKFRHFGVLWDPYVSLFALVRNHVLVPSLDEASLLAALGRGRLHWGFDGAADTGGSRFEAFRGDLPAAAMGDTVPGGPGLSLAVLLPAPARVTVLRDGAPWREGEGRVLFFPVEGPGVYRAEADLLLAGAWRPWARFNPVRVAAPAAGAP